MFTDDDYRLFERAREKAAEAWSNEAPWPLLVEVRALLAPLVEKGMPEALFEASCFALPDEFPPGVAFDDWRCSLLQRSAVAGYAPAQFELGKAYDGGHLGDQVEASAHWFRLAAEQGYAHAQWVHGLNLLAGRGLEQDRELGYSWVIRAAEGRFVGAMEFLADAYAAGTHGFPRDEAQAGQWRELALSDGVIGY
jgi:TPR repeat protein